MRSWCWLTVWWCMGCGGEAMDLLFTVFNVDPAEAQAGATVDVEVEIENFVLTGASHHHDDGHEDHDRDHDGVQEGHVHIYFDTTDANPLLQLTESRGQMEIPEEAEVGGHVLIARLHDASHMILQPEVVAELDFEVLE